MNDMFKSKYGVVAVEKGKLLGYLAFWGGWDGQFGNVKGSFSPLFANAITGVNRGKTASLLFQHASEEMNYSDAGSLLSLKNGLAGHLRKSEHT